MGTFLIRSDYCIFLNPACIKICSSWLYHGCRMISHVQFEKKEIQVRIKKLAKKNKGLVARVILRNQFNKKLTVIQGNEGKLLCFIPDV